MFGAHVLVSAHTCVRVIAHSELGREGGGAREAAIACNLATRYTTVVLILQRDDYGSGGPGPDLLAAPASATQGPPRRFRDALAELRLVAGVRMFFASTPDDVARLVAGLWRSAADASARLEVDLPPTRFFAPHSSDASVVAFLSSWRGSNPVVATLLLDRFRGTNLTTALAGMSADSLRSVVRGMPAVRASKMATFWRRVWSAEAYAMVAAPASSGV